MYLKLIYHPYGRLHVHFYWRLTGFVNIVPGGGDVIASAAKQSLVKQRALLFHAKGICH
jgi:hypothetical protein